MALTFRCRSIYRWRYHFSRPAAARIVFCNGQSENGLNSEFLAPFFASRSRGLAPRLGWPTEKSGRNRKFERIRALRWIQRLFTVVGRSEGRKLLPGKNKLPLLYCPRKTPYIFTTESFSNDAQSSAVEFRVEARIFAFAFSLSFSKNTRNTKRDVKPKGRTLVTFRRNKTQPSSFFF